MHSYKAFKAFRVVLCCVLLLIPSFTSPAKAQAGESLPVIHNAADVHPGDTMAVMANVSDSAGVSSVTANMGGIEAISLNLVLGSLYDGTWQATWLVHGTEAGDYITTVTATNALGYSSSFDISWRDPPPTIQRYYTTLEEDVSTTSTSWVDPEPKTDFYPLKLTFTPPAEGKYLVMACATLSNSSTSYYTNWQFLRETAGDTTEICRRQYKPREDGDYVPFGAHDLMTLGPQEYTFRMQFSTENASGTALMRHARIIIFQIDDYYHEADEPESSTTETTYQDKTILTFTPPTSGDYLVIA